jgi:hypothetical protein
MKREVCPNCGGVLAAETLGWICRDCRGFISLQDGKFYEYVERPFMPPMTNADRIRAMSDEELCEMLTIGTGGFDCGTCRDSNECDRECELHCAEWLKTTCKGR